MPKTQADKTLVQLPFGRGQDEGTPAFIQEPGAVTALTNGRILRNGSIEVRRGFETLPGTVPGSADLFATDAFSHGNQLLAFDAHYIYQWSESAQLWGRTDHAPEAQLIAVDIGKRGIVDSISYPQQESCDAVQVGAYRVIAWVIETSGGHMVCTQVVDTVSGGRTAEQRWLGLDHDVRLCVIGSKVYCTYRTTTAHLRTRVLDLTSVVTLLLGWSAEVAVVDDSSTTRQGWEAASIGGYLVIAYTQTDGAGLTKGCMRRWNAALTASADCLFAGYAYRAYGLNGLGGVSDVVMCSYDNFPAATGILVSGATLSTMASLYSDVVIDAATVIYDSVTGASTLERIGIANPGTGGSARVVYSRGAYPDLGLGNLEPVVVTREVTLATGATLAGTTLYNWTLVGQPISREGGDYVYAPLQVADKSWQQYTVSIDESLHVYTLQLPSLQPHIFLVSLPLSLASPRVVVRLCPYLGVSFGSVHHLPSTFLLDGGWTYLYALPKKSEGSALDAGFDCYTFSFKTYDAAKRAVRFGPISLLSGGVPTQWDGEQLTEVGWHYYPRIGVMSQAAGGSMTLLGVYSYCAVYSWLDSTGQKHYSTPSAPCSITLAGANQTATVDVDCLTITERKDYANDRCPVMIELYRTVASGTEYYFCGRAINTTAAKVTFTDTLSDSTVETRPMLPTRGGTYAGGCPGASRQIAVHDGRPWSLQAENPNTIAFGHYSLTGDTARFPDGWVKTCARGHAYTAIGTTQSCLLAFQAHAIDAIYGTGPNEQGQGSNYSDPVLVCETVGCADARSLVRFPGGYLFNTAAGIWAIDEGFKAQPLGFPIEDTLALYPTINAMLIDDSEHRVVALVSNGDGTSGSMLAWYYKWNLWSVWGPHDSSGGHSPALGGCIYDRAGVRRIVYADGLGHVASERTDTTYKDQNGAFIPLTIRYGWLSLAGLQGWQHVWNMSLLGSYRDKTAVSIACCYDYSTAATDTHSWTEAETAALVSGTRLQLPLGATRHEAQSIRITVSLTTTDAAATGAMTRLEILTLEAAPEPGLALPPPGARK